MVSFLNHIASILSECGLRCGAIYYPLFRGVLGEYFSLQIARLITSLLSLNAELCRDIFVIHGEVDCWPLPPINHSRWGEKFQQKVCETNIHLVRVVLEAGTGEPMVHCQLVSTCMDINCDECFTGANSPHLYWGHFGVKCLIFSVTLSIVLLKLF